MYVCDGDSSSCAFLDSDDCAGIPQRSLLLMVSSGTWALESGLLHLPTDDAFGLTRVKG